MTYLQVLKHFGTQAAIVRAFRARGYEMSQPSVSEWKTAGVPELRQFQLEEITDGKLVADRPRQAA